jgi:hypothetical protein
MSKNDRFKIRKKDNGKKVILGTSKMHPKLLLHSVLVYLQFTFRTNKRLVPGTAQVAWELGWVTSLCCEEYRQYL